MKDLHTLFRTSLAGLRVLVLMTLVLGVAYPLAITGIAQATMPWHADGSLVTADGSHTTDRGDAVGSAIVGQVVDDERLFQPRPSAAGDGYDLLSTYGSNLGPLSPELVTTIEERKAEVAEREGVDASAVPADAVTASASGLDPHISTAYAALQVPRVARLTGLDQDEVRRLVEDHTDGRTLGVLGEPHVNVLTLDAAVLAALG
ncbi:potassium-transporting ATPase subunit KdpC [Nocardioides sp. 503]|uniref:potassium-transporting ATPase subunit KdpC n=1 Tax=Nocardioides sp. 503 TaxID=2508326 RepID=UPI00106FCF3A|nr:potassium-transporting ATPase subunit KdpC [Nocardioides sp. 503]